MEEPQNHTPLMQLILLQAATYGVVKMLISQEKLPLQLEQLSVMMCIYYHGFVSQQEIANAVFRDKSSVHRTIAKLEYRGFLEIYRGKDKRKKMLKLSESGRKIATRIATFPPPAAIQDRSVNAMNTKIANQLRQVIDSIKKDLVID